MSVIATGEIHDVPLPADLRTHLWAVTWFPDGEKFLFSASSDTEGSAIWVTSVFGGGLRKLQNDGGIWAVASPQGSSVAFMPGKGREIWVMGANGESPHRILTAERENDTYYAVAWSPVGRRLAYLKATSQTERSIETVSLDGGPPSAVISDTQLGVGGGNNLVWARDGRIIFTLEHGVGGQGGSNLSGIMVDPQTGKPAGMATKITNWDGVYTYSGSISSDAKLLALVKTHNRNDVFVGELVDGGMRLASPTRLTVSESDNFVTGWGDNNSVLFRSNRTGIDQIHTQRMNDESAEPLVRSMNDEDGAGLSPDGRWILYWSAEPREGKSPTTKQLMRIPASGGAPEKVLEVGVDDAADFDCPTRPRSSCVMSHWEQGQLIFYALDPIRGRGKELARTKLTRPTDLSQAISPEGSRIAITSQDQLREHIRILDSTTGTEHELQLPGGWGLWSIRWTADGNALIAAAQSKSGYFISRIALDGKIRVLLDEGKNHWLGYAIPSPDGRHLAFTQETKESNAWLLENF